MRPCSLGVGGLEKIPTSRCHDLPACQRISPARPTKLARFRRRPGRLHAVAPHCSPKPGSNPGTMQNGTDAHTVSPFHATHRTGSRLRCWRATWTKTGPSPTLRLLCSRASPPSRQRQSRTRTLTRTHSPRSLHRTASAITNASLAQSLRQTLPSHECKAVGLDFRVPPAVLPSLGPADLDAIIIQRLRREQPNAALRPPSYPPPPLVALVDKPKIAKMPLRLESPLVRVEPASFHTIDTSNVENLMGMWSGKPPDAMRSG